MELLFGTGGTPKSAKNHSTIGGIEHIAGIGLGCMEVEFVQGVKMGESMAREVAKTARRLNIRLTCHAPYFINLNSGELEKIQASQYRLVQTARIGTLCGVESIVFHTAVYGGQSPDEAYFNIKKNLTTVLDQLHTEGITTMLRPEVLGKSTQFGTIDEVLKLCKELDLLPCVDFAHWHARTGENNSYAEFKATLQAIEKQLGRKTLDNMHMHISGIKYGKKGELAHLNLAEADLDYKALLKALKDQKAGGFAICESPNLEIDALKMQTEYRGIK